jgi:hypothetical protein
LPNHLQPSGWYYRFVLGAIAKKAQFDSNNWQLFCNAYLQQPIKWGAHLVVHSATKLMDGRVCGVTVGDPELIQKIYLFSRLTDLHCLRSMHGFCLKFRDFGHPIG